MISLENISKYYPTWRGRHYVFRDISLTIPSGKNVGLFGPNGAGKSTLLRIIGGIDYPTKGKVRSTASLSWPMGLGSGWQGSMTGRENSRFVCRLYGLNEHQVREVGAFVQSFSELDHYFDMPVRTYSSGMRSRLSFAISMAFEFDYYLIDELTAVGDKRFKDKSSAALEERKGRSNYLMVSHNVRKLAKDVDMALFISDGEVLLVEDPQEALWLYEKAS
jgi:capsular polysaccharide transport system ATP-binding protein